MIERPIDELWTKSLNYWNSLKGKMVNTYISENLLRRKIEFKHDASGQFIHNQFVLSLGETYIIEFGYNRDDNCIYLTLEVEFHWFGRDNVWRIPQHYVTRWLDFLGYESIHLQHGKSVNFVRISEKLVEIENRKKYNSFCPICGSKMQSNTSCSDCGFSSYEAIISF